MRICYNQPVFIPWGGFFARLMSSDRMVLLDETVLAHGFTYVNRNRIKGPEGEVWITVPLKRKGRGRQKIKDLETYEKQRWARRFPATLKHYYGKSVYFGDVYTLIQAVIDRADDRFVDLALGLMRILKVGLGIDNEIVLQSGLGITGKGTPLLLSIAKELRAQEVILPYGSDRAIDCTQFAREDIRLRLLRYLPPPYPQFWGRFLMNLSALDLLLCCGSAGRAVIERGVRFSEIGEINTATK